MAKGEKSLATLIKLHKRELDLLRRRLTNLEIQKNALIALSVKLAEELENEINLAASQVEMSNFFGNYADRIRDRQDTIRQEVLALNKQILAMQAEIAESFSELKKYEIALENRRRAEREEMARKETIQLDDLGIAQFIRKEENLS